MFLNDVFPFKLDTQLVEKGLTVSGVVKGSESHGRLRRKGRKPMLIEHLLFSKHLVRNSRYFLFL